MTLSTDSPSPFNKMENSTDNGSTKLGLFDQDPSLHTFVFAVDFCLASFSILNLVVNSFVSFLSIGFLRSGCGSSTDRPHYALHIFIFHCVFCSFLLESIGTITNIGYIVAGQNVLISHIQSVHSQQMTKKVLDFLTYSLFNMSHLNFVLLLNVDKLLYVLRPLHYHEIMNRTRVCLVCLVTWLVALAMASPSLMYLETNAQIRQEAILFAMCVVCPASFDLLSAIIVSTIVYRIQMGDTRTEQSIRPRSASNRGRLFRSNHHEDSTSESTGINRFDYHPARDACQNFFRHCRVFLRAFTPIIWTCVTTLPYTATMIYLYFGSENEADFVRRWTDITMFKVLRSLGCLYVTYFTGVPLLIIFNNHIYRKRIRSLFSAASRRLKNKRMDSKTYSAVTKTEYMNNNNSRVDATVPLTKCPDACAPITYTEM